MLEIRNKLRKDMKTIKKIINEDEELSKLQQERIRKRQNLQSIATELREFLLSGESYDAAMKKFNLSRRQINKFVQTDRKKQKNKEKPQTDPDSPTDVAREQSYLTKPKETMKLSNFINRVPAGQNLCRCLE